MKQQHQQPTQPYANARSTTTSLRLTNCVAAATAISPLPSMRRGTSGSRTLPFRELMAKYQHSTDRPLRTLGKHWRALPNSPECASSCFGSRYAPVTPRPPSRTSFPPSMERQWILKSHELCVATPSFSALPNLHPFVWDSLVRMKIRETNTPSDFFVLNRVP